MDKNVALPASILAGSALIGAGLYFGLQGSAPPAGAPTATASPEASAPPPSPAPSAKGADPATIPRTEAGPGEAAPAAVAPPAAPAGVEARARKDAAAALEAQRATLVEKCWKPAVAKAPEPSRSTYSYQLSFNPAGVAIARGISEIRGDSRADVAQCLRSLPLDITIPAPGAVVSVELDFALP